MKKKIPAVQIYAPTRGVVIEGMQKPAQHRCDAACKRAGHKYRHRFKELVEIFGLFDANGKPGNVLLRRK